MRKLDSRVAEIESKLPVPANEIVLWWYTGMVLPRQVLLPDGRTVYETVEDASPHLISRLVFDWVAQLEPVVPGMAYAAHLVYSEIDGIAKWRLEVGQGFFPKSLSQSCEQFAMGDVQRIRDVYQEMQRREPGWSYCDLPKSEAESTPSESAEKGYG